MMDRYKRPAGWRRESYRHYLAAKGVKTKKYYSQVTGYHGTSARVAKKIINEGFGTDPSKNGDGNPAPAAHFTIDEGSARNYGKAVIAVDFEIDDAEQAELDELFGKGEAPLALKGKGVSNKDERTHIVVEGADAIRRLKPRRDYFAKKTLRCVSVD